MKIYANHAHVFQKEVREDGTIDCLKRVMDICGIERAVAFAPFYSLFDCGVGRAGDNPNCWLAAQIEHDDNLYGFGVVDFERDDLDAKVRQISALGLNGIKLHPAFQKFRLDGEKAFAVYRAAEEEGLPVSFHSGVHWHRISDYNVLLHDEIAYHFPKLRFSMEHVGGYSFFKEAVAVMVNNRGGRVFAGLTSVFDTEMNRFWYLGRTRVEELLWQTGAEQCIFGLDFPYNNAERISEAISAVYSLSATDEDKEKILGGNLMRFIRLE